MSVESTCDKWEYFRIDYVQGYTNYCAFFTKVVPGDLVLFINTPFNGPIRVRFDSHVKMRKPEQFSPSSSEIK
jgi:hypothetical protein